MKKLSEHMEADEVLEKEKCKESILYLMSHSSFIRVAGSLPTYGYCSVNNNECQNV